MPYSYNDFLNAATSSGLLGEFSQADLETAQRYPEFGLSILSLNCLLYTSPSPRD